MTPRSITTLAIVVLSLAACAEQTDWVKGKLGRQPDVVIDPAAVEKIQSDAAAKHFVTDESLIQHSLGETILQPGRFRWFATLIEANGGGLLYVGTKSNKVADGSIETDVIFKSPERGTLDIHVILEREDGVWVSKPNFYALTEESPKSAKAGDDKRPK